MAIRMSGNPEIPVPNGLSRLLDHTYAAHQIRLDLTLLINKRQPA